MSFFLVKHSNDQHLILNSECQVRVLLDWIRKKCGLERGTCVDLSDEEGRILDLIYKGGEYASQWIIPRKLYLLVKVEILPYGRKYEPLFDLITEKDLAVSEIIQQHSVYDDRVRSQSPKPDRMLSVWKSASRAFSPTSHRKKQK